jgi:hypothetical protein
MTKSVAQMVGCLPSKHEALNLKPEYCQKKKKQQKKLSLNK